MHKYIHVAALVLPALLANVHMHVGVVEDKVGQVGASNWMNYWSIIKYQRYVRMTILVNLGQTSYG